MLPPPPPSSQFSLGMAWRLLDEMGLGAGRQEYSVHSTVQVSEAKRASE